MNRSKTLIATGALLVAGMLASAAPSHAFRMIQNTGIGRFSAGSLVTCNNLNGFVHWADSTIPINWYHNTAGQGLGKDAALQNAMAAWTNVAGANHTLVYAGQTGAGFVTDGQNTVLWALGNGCTGSCLAITALVLVANQVIVETDISFNSAVTWTTTGANFDTQATATHEFGHSLGMHHTEINTGSALTQPTMFASYFGAEGRSLQADDIAALQCAENRY